jgi:hypothetical protein
MHIHDSVCIVSLEAIGESATGNLLRYRDRCSIVRNVSQSKLTSQQGNDVAVKVEFHRDSS